MKKTLITLMAAASLLAACDGSDNIENSIWINDPDDFCLPKYSEWGYNTFGAQMGRSYFVSNWRDIPCSMEWHDEDSTLEFTMNGCQAFKNDRYGSEYMTFGGNMSLTIIIRCDSIIDGCQKLYMLDKKTFDLNAPGITVLVKNKDNLPEPISDIRSGEFCFKRVQMLYVDGKFEEAIVSGTFDIRYVKDGEKTWLSDGRFDLDITNKLFW